MMREYQVRCCEQFQVKLLGLTRPVRVTVRVMLLRIHKQIQSEDFYLDYAIENPIYSTDWRLFYPQNLEKISRHSLQD